MPFVPICSPSGQKEMKKKKKTAIENGFCLLPPQCIFEPETSFISSVFHVILLAAKAKNNIHQMKENKIAFALLLPT